MRLPWRERSTLVAERLWQRWFMSCPQDKWLEEYAAMRKRQGQPLRVVFDIGCNKVACAQLVAVGGVASRCVCASQGYTSALYLQMLAPQLKFSNQKVTSWHDPVCVWASLLTRLCRCWLFTSE